MSDEKKIIVVDMTLVEPGSLPDDRPEVLTVDMAEVDRRQQMLKALGVRHQMIRNYLTAATKLVWHMQQALRCDGEPPPIESVVTDARRLAEMAGVIEALAQTEQFIRDLYSV